MFHLASLKMGLDQAVLKGFEKGAGSEAGMTKEEVERLLKHGAYDILNEDKAGTAEAASNEFMQLDIDAILAGRSRTVVHENTGSQSGAAGGTFSKASFQMTKTPGKEKEAVDLDDPNFWAKVGFFRFLPVGREMGLFSRSNNFFFSYSRRFSAKNISRRKQTTTPSKSANAIKPTTTKPPISSSSKRPSWMGFHRTLSRTVKARATTTNTMLVADVLPGGRQKTTNGVSKKPRHLRRISWHLDTAT